MLIMSSARVMYTYRVPWAARVICLYLYHISIAPAFKPCWGYFRGVLHLSLRIIIFGGRSIHLAYLVHKRSRKTAKFARNLNSTIRQRGIQVLLHWFPSRFNLEGNDWAYQLANELPNEATSLEVSEHAKHTHGTFNHLGDRFSSNQLESIYTYHTSASNDWYHNTTVVGHNLLNNRLADTQLRRLSFWTYTRNVTVPSPLTLCRYPSHPKHRRILKGHLRTEDYKLPDHHLAALIISKSTFLPNIINPLLQKDPYKYQQQQ